MRAIHKLSALKVANLKQPGLYADGGCLYFRVAPGGSRQWVFRFGLGGKMRDAGIGPFPTVSLAKARQQAEAYRQLVAAGVDPIEQRKDEREATRIASAKTMTFEQCAKAFMASHEAAWSSSDHRRQWASTLATYVYPVIGALPVEAIDTASCTRFWSRCGTRSRRRHRVCAAASRRC